MRFNPIARNFNRRFLVFLILFAYLSVFGQNDFNPGSVVLKWTASGDDGYSGQAAGYDIRYQPVSRGPIDTEDEWLTAQNVYGEPSPSPAGYIDSMEIGGLGYGIAYYFCIRAYDQAGNYSPLSNSPVIVSGDSVGCPYTPGDVNGDGSVSLFDVTYLISFVYTDGPDPQPYEAGDVNISNEINIFDITYLIFYLYMGGPAPGCFY